jgi:hypothetical protein
MIYAFNDLPKKCKSFSEDARHSRSILNDTVDLQVQAADHHRNIAGIGIRQHPVNVARIQRWNPATFAGIRSVQIPATNLAGRLCRNPATFAGIRLSHTGYNLEIKEGEYKYLKRTNQFKISLYIVLHKIINVALPLTMHELFSHIAETFP